MKIDFRKKEYHALVEKLHVADCLIHGHEVGSCVASQPYDDRRKKLRSHHKGNFPI